MFRIAVTLRPSIHGLYHNHGDVPVLSSALRRAIVRDWILFPVSLASEAICTNALVDQFSDNNLGSLLRELEIPCRAANIVCIAFHSRLHIRIGCHCHGEGIELLARLRLECHRAGIKMQVNPIWKLGPGDFAQVRCYAVGCPRWYGRSDLNGHRPAGVTKEPE